MVILSNIKLLWEQVPVLSDLKKGINSSVPSFIILIHILFVF